jgi:endonuclease/exonuclease/phosphatase family metal-dependent hydrolase
MAVLLHTEKVLGRNLLVLNSHLACCTNDESRQHDADEIIQVLRRWRDGFGPFPISANTPMIHLGDFNLVGSSQQLKTLTEGDILDESSFGSDFFPDWDNSGLTDLFSRHTSIRMGYTWRNDKSAFSPGKLDYILFTDSIIEPGNHYVMNTLAMPVNELDKYRLLPDDTNLASDHLPRIMDIASVKTFSTNEDVDHYYNFQLFQAYPNPCNSYTIIPFELSNSSSISIKVHNILGEEIYHLKEKRKDGPHSVRIHLDDFKSGVYFYTLTSGKDEKTRRFLLIK